MNIGEEVFIQSYKHDGKLHRTWSTGSVISISDECWVIMTYKTMVIESNGRIWQTREPAVCFFYPNEWYNIIAMIRKNGITYYCNVASPSIYDGEAIKNIDYDLDLKVYPSGEYHILDEDEFLMHADSMGYSDSIKKIAYRSLNKLITMAENGESPFNDDVVLKFFRMFLSNHSWKK